MTEKIRGIVVAYFDIFHKETVPLTLALLNLLKGKV
jgi:hypothetical protein